MADTRPSRGLSRFAFFTAAGTLFLIGVGGIVTSKEAGMAVPDWPNSYGYNMFFFPFSKWVGGVFYEHSHRLTASFVGLLTLILSAWIWLKDQRSWLKKLSLIAVVAVILQGVLGGLRVLWDRHGWGDEIGIFHATLAQLFFVLVASMTLVLSSWWARPPLSKPVPEGLHRWIVAATLLIFVQLLLGAVMRHQHAGLAVPDFPLAYGKVWPSTSPSAVRSYNQMRTETTALNPITANQVVLHMFHRTLGIVIFLTVLSTTWFAQRCLSKNHFLSKLSLVWFALVFSQVILGAATVWSGKSADIATAHVALGALILMLGFLMNLICHRLASYHREVLPTEAGAGLEKPSSLIPASKA